MSDLMKSRGNKPRTGRVAACLICGAEFYDRPSGKRKYCSRKCQAESYRTNSPLKCLYCDKEFYASKSQVKYRNRKTCSRRCSTLLLSKKGPECNFWRGGVSAENRKIRYSFDMDQWRKGVFERDNYTCQVCSRRGGYLHAHHIKQFALYPELRFEITNGKTLCKECHNAEHKKAKQEVVS